ncbi:MAG: metallophosphoesterase [Gammaproteobacteria bacterium]|nr:metallophosphoesterase [Gammaproteobacteria bacterium]
MSFQFAHISDLHLPPLPAVAVGEVLNKRLLGWLSWHRKRRRRHRPDVVAALERLLGERRLDHICITGDVTNLGLAREFQAADQWLSKFALPDTLTFVPGNHDAYTAASVDAMRIQFGRWLPDRFPSVTRRNGITFIGVSSAVPTPPLAATGRIGRGQMERLASILDDSDQEPAHRVLIIHHPPRQGIVSRRKALSDATELQRLLHERPVDLVLHGHGHHAAQYQLPCVAGMIPVFGAGSATQSHGETARTGHFHVFRVDEDELRVTHYHYQPDRDYFVPGREQPVPRRAGNH